MHRVLDSSQLYVRGCCYIPLRRWSRVSWVVCTEPLRHGHPEPPLGADSDARNGRHNRHHRWFQLRRTIRYLAHLITNAFNLPTILQQPVIQFSKLAGFSNIITTSSIKHTHALKSMGATHVIDRSLRFPAISAEISEITGGLPITFVFDAISEPDTQQTAYDLLAPSDGQLVTVLPEAVKEKIPGKTVNMIHVVVLREEPESSKELLLLYRKINTLLHEGAIKVGLLTLPACRPDCHAC